MPLILKRMQKIEHIGIAVSNIEEASKLRGPFKQ